MSAYDNMQEIWGEIRSLDYVTGITNDGIDVIVSCIKGKDVSKIHSVCKELGHKYRIVEVNKTEELDTSKVQIPKNGMPNMSGMFGRQ